MLSTSSKRSSFQFSDIAHNITERVNPSKTKSDVYVGLEHLSPDSIHLLKWGHPSDVIGDKFVFRKGDVIFGKRRAYQRKLAIADVDGICSAHAMVLRANTKTILPEFLPFFLSSDLFMERAIGISVGSLSPTINWSTLKREQFSIPSLEEQKRLVDVLLAADEVIEKIREVGRDLHQYKNALYFSYFLREDLPRRSLQSLGIVNMGQSPESRFCGSEVNGLPFFQGCTDFGEMYPQTSTYCSKPRKTASQNDILISVRAPVGEVNIATEECCIGRGIAAITPIQIPRMYLFHALKANANKLSQYEQGSTFKAINKNELMNFEIAYIDTTTTQQITRTLESLDTATNNLAEHLLDSRVLLSYLVNNLIFGAENV